jgi:hypothetical protein
MRYFLISLLLLATIPSFSQTKEFSGGGAISFDQTVYVFGTVKEEGGSVSYDFKFTNTGRGPLRIKNVLTSCGCTTPEWTQNVVNPGETGLVKATFDPKNRPGHFSRTLTVITNGSPESVVLTLEGDVVSGATQMQAMFPGVSGNLRFSGQEIVIPGIREDKTDTIWLGVYNASNKNMLIRNIITPYQMRVDSKHIVLLPEQGDNIMMTYNASLVKELGQKINDIVLVTSDDSVPTKTIKIRANILQNFDKMTPEQRLNPPIASLDKMEADAGTVYQGELAKYTFELTNKGKMDLVIRRIFSGSGDVTGTVPAMVVKKGQKVKVTVTLKTKGKHGPVEDYLQLTMNDPAHSIVYIKLKAKVIIPGIDPLPN